MGMKRAYRINEQARKVIIYGKVVAGEEGISDERLGMQSR